jgi:acetyl coenzyme A synthetase (ADP forming)-like protein
MARLLLDPMSMPTSNDSKVHMRHAPPVPPAADDVETARLILRDGTLATVRSSNTTDREAIRQFFHRLSPESQRYRFFSAGCPSDALLERFLDSSEPRRQLTLIALRRVDEADRVIAVASYFALAGGTAEIAFAVDDRFHRKGLSTLLLERLAIHAERHGFHTFQAGMLADNTEMRQVFRDSGFAIKSSLNSGIIELQLSVTPSAEGVEIAERRRQRATAESMRPLLAPETVAVIGASRDPHKIGARVLRALQSAGYTGSVYPVNPNAAEIGGLRAFPSARDLPSGVDLAIITVPPECVLGAVEDCAVASVRSLVVITAGFAEVGEEGRARQEALTERVRSHGMRMIGPNCLGLLNLDPRLRLNASFSPVMSPPGNIALSSQSGALGIAILRLAADRQIGLSAFVSVGNKADVSSNDLLEYWEGDPRTGVILLYLESFGNPRRFARIARRISRHKPIVALKAGRTSAGSRAAGSHTAALAARDAAVDALFRQTGVIRAETIDELFDIASCLDAQPLPAGSRVAIVTNAGGPGILAVDACDAAGLQVPELLPETQRLLRTFLPPTASATNPVDMVASAGAEHYRQVIETVLAADNTDALLVVYTQADDGDPAIVLSGIQAGIAAARAAGLGHKPVLACLLTDSTDWRPFRVRGETIPTYAFPENAVRALGKIAAYASWRSQPSGSFWTFDDVRVEEARAVCRNALARGDTWLSGADTSAVLEAFGLPVPAQKLTRTADEAGAFASSIGFPVAAKLASTRFTHKTELGAVRLNLATQEEVRAAFREIVARAEQAGGAAAVDGVLVQPMIAGGVETIVGIAHDPVFGPLVGFGLGGVTVEALGDVRFRVVPLTDRDADSLVCEIRGVSLLTGFRGRPPADLDAVREVLLRISYLAEAVPEISELDLNPLIALAPGNGCRIVDARIRVAADSRPSVALNSHSHLVTGCT